MRFKIVLSGVPFVLPLLPLSNSIRARSLPHIIVMSSPAGSTAISRAERIEEIIRKIKDISSSIASPTPSCAAKSKVQSSSSPRVCLPQVPQPPLSPSKRIISNSPSSPIDIIFSATKDRRSPSSPKLLRAYFPSPPLFSLPTESRISLPVEVENPGARPKVNVKFPALVGKSAVTSAPLGTLLRILKTQHTPSGETQVPRALVADVEKLVLVVPTEHFTHRQI